MYIQLPPSYLPHTYSYMLSIKKLGKDERKKMKASEVERESLRTTPASTLLKSSKARRKKKNTEEKTDEATAAE